ncbi:KOW domain-containing RNA-binding protein [Scatolibacter rhodanostii]|uniref:KOW domain-containing RNA-binding protein n=1 Tax=Scatolibacter rhodanostii TaxID=2014781 RepID=UPI000C08B614|nr:KOW domain-containing RNA-binding protein [Scatolibacter rhodanostii]
MEIKRGQVVKSKAGHDKGDFQVILELQLPYALVCDGKRRTLEKPKKKKLIHLAPTTERLDEEKLKTNRHIKIALRAFMNKSDDDKAYC